MVLLATLLLGPAAALAAEVELPSPPSGSLPSGAPPPDSGAAPAPAAPPASSPAPVAPASPVALTPLSLRAGAFGQAVRDLQRELRRRGLRVTVDGAYGPGTRAAVRALQRRMKLPPTGEADAGLLRRLGIRSRAVASGPGTTLAPVPLPVGVAAPVVSAARYLKVFPVQGESTYTDDYGDPRGQGAHQGNDIVAPQGTPVVAVADGTIQRLTRAERGLGGIYVYLLDVEGNSYYYAHLNEIEVGIEEGTRVAADQRIASVGNTGDARYGAPHLHFEIHPGDGGAINPYSELRAVEPASTTTTGPS